MSRITKCISCMMSGRIGSRKRSSPNTKPPTVNSGSDMIYPSMFFAMELLILPMSTLSTLRCARSAAQWFLSVPTISWVRAPTRPVQLFTSAASARFRLVWSRPRPAATCKRSWIRRGNATKTKPFKCSSRAPTLSTSYPRKLKSEFWHTKI